MAKVGDTVRFLNTTGGGKIIRIEGNMAFVDDEGFETPVLLKEVVVVLPAGKDQASGTGVKLMFDQQAFDEGKKREETDKTPAKAIESYREEEELPIEETGHGDVMNIVLAFEPSDVKHLDKSTFAAILVNDSNYYLDFTFLRRSEEERGWTLVKRGTVLPNEMADLANLTHETLSQYEKITFQCIAYKKDKAFVLQAPLGISRRLDLTKFHKFHCFRPGIYFENEVIEISLVANGAVKIPQEVNVAELKNSLTSRKNEKDLTAELSRKYRVDKGRGQKQKPGVSDTKVLPLIEVDLHIGELTDSIAGMEAKDMLELQLDRVRKEMEAHQRRKGQKIVFIHGKGDGVLRKSVLELLRKEYPKAEVQDASFREYGFGASLVTVH